MSEYPREGMVDLINRLRRLCNDVRGVDMSFVDENLQAYLDQNKTRRNYVELIPEPTIYSGGSVAYLTFCSPVGGNFEGTAASSNQLTFVDSNYGTVTPTSYDNLNGRWTFGTAPTRPVKVIGWNYDLYATAADVLEEKAATVAEWFDFQTQGLTYSMGEVQKRILQTADRYRGRASTVKVATMVRGDMW